MKKKKKKKTKYIQIVLRYKLFKTKNALHAKLQ